MQSLLVLLNTVKNDPNIKPFVKEGLFDPNLEDFLETEDVGLYPTHQAVFQLMFDLADFVIIENTFDETKAEFLTLAGFPIIKEDKEGFKLSVQLGDYKMAF